MPYNIILSYVHMLFIIRHVYLSSLLPSFDLFNLTYKLIKLLIVKIKLSRKFNLILKYEYNFQKLSNLSSNAAQFNMFLLPIKIFIIASHMIDR